VPLAPIEAGRGLSDLGDSAPHRSAVADRQILSDEAICG
jgi:hypothetical protein